MPIEIQLIYNSNGLRTQNLLNRFNKVFNKVVSEEFITYICYEFLTNSVSACHCRIIG